MIFPDQPLRFAPLFRSYIWGGRRLSERLGKRLPNDGDWAESWEIVDHREGESVVADGPHAGRTLRQLIEIHPQSILGPQAAPTGTSAAPERFPLLLKYLDCQRVLSVQVHPNDAYGAQMAVPDRGKTEAWYIVDAEPGSVLYAGLRSGVDRATLSEAIRHGETEQCLHTLYPEPGDCIFIPAGTVHALGSGLIVAEIQQASDCTFRLFDWNRVDVNGHPRPLHIDQALEVIDFETGPVAKVSPIAQNQPGQSLLVDCDKFQLFECKGPGEFILPEQDFAIVTLPKGKGEIRTGSSHQPMELGESILVPAACKDATLILGKESIGLVAVPPISRRVG